MDCYSDTLQFSISNYLNYMMIQFFIFCILCAGGKLYERLLIIG